MHRKCDAAHPQPGFLSGRLPRTEQKQRSNTFDRTRRGYSFSSQETSVEEMLHPANADPATETLNPIAGISPSLWR